MNDILYIHLNSGERMCDDLEECCLATRQKKEKLHWESAFAFVASWSNYVVHL